MKYYVHVLILILLEDGRRQINYFKGYRGTAYRS